MVTVIVEISSTDDEHTLEDTILEFNATTNITKNPRAAADMIMHVVQNSFVIDGVEGWQPDYKAAHDFSKDYSTDHQSQLSVKEITTETVDEIMNSVPELTTLSVERRMKITEQFVTYFLEFYKEGMERGKNDKL